MAEVAPAQGGLYMGSGPGGDGGDDDDGDKRRRQGKHTAGCSSDYESEEAEEEEEGDEEAAEEGARGKKRPLRNILPKQKQGDGASTAVANVLGITSVGRVQSRVHNSVRLLACRKTMRTGKKDGVSVRVEGLGDLLGRLQRGYGMETQTFVDVALAEATHSRELMEARVAEEGGQRGLANNVTYATNLENFLRSNDVVATLNRSMAVEARRGVDDEQGGAPARKPAAASRPSKAKKARRNQGAQEAAQALVAMRGAGAPPLPPSATQGPTSTTTSAHAAPPTQQPAPAAPALPTQRPAPVVPAHRAPRAPRPALPPSPPPPLPSAGAQALPPGPPASTSLSIPGSAVLRRGPSQVAVAAQPPPSGNRAPTSAHQPVRPVQPTYAVRSALAASAILNVHQLPPGMVDSALAAVGITSPAEAINLFTAMGRSPLASLFLLPPAGQPGSYAPGSAPPSVVMPPDPLGARRRPAPPATDSMLSTPRSAASMPPSNHPTGQHPQSAHDSPPPLARSNVSVPPVEAPPAPEAAYATVTLPEAAPAAKPAPMTSETAVATAQYAVPRSAPGLTTTLMPPGTPPTAAPVPLAMAYPGSSAYNASLPASMSLAPPSQSTLARQWYPPPPMYPPPPTLFPAPLPPVPWTSPMPAYPPPPSYPPPPRTAPAFSPEDAAHETNGYKTPEKAAQTGTSSPATPPTASPPPRPAMSLPSSPVRKLPREDGDSEQPSRDE
jgi:hypothetical protein